MERETKEFAVGDYLDFSNSEEVAAYLNAAIETDAELGFGSMDTFLAAVGQVAKAHGITRLAKETGLSRTSLYKVIRPGAAPSFETVSKILVGLGLRLSIQIVEKGK